MNNSRLGSPPQSTGPPALRKRANGNHQIRYQFAVVIFGVGLAEGASRLSIIIFPPPVGVCLPLTCLRIPLLCLDSTQKIGSSIIVSVRNGWFNLFALPSSPPPTHHHHHLFLLPRLLLLHSHPSPTPPSPHCATLIAPTVFLTCVKNIVWACFGQPFPN